MEVKRENTSKQEVKLTITLTAEEVKPFLMTAASHISEHMDIAGFRKGKATYEAIVNNVGEMRVMEEAIEPMVRLHLAKAMMDEQIDSVGQPQVDIEKMAPGNDVVFTAKITLMPTVEKLADFKKLSVDGKSTAAEDKDIERALKDLTGMQTKEVRAEAGTAVTKDGLAVIDLEMTKDKVPVEGGSTQGFKVYMAEDHYVPGMTKEIVGLKEGDKKTFTITFPDEHYQKHLAGHPVEFAVEVKEVYTLDRPEVNDAFAKTLGLKDEKELRAKIVENLEAENKEQEKRRVEREALEVLAEKSKYSEIPEFLVDDEIEKMVHELEHAVTSQGGVFADYLASIKKSPKELRDGMRDQALMRVKVALVLREIGKQEGVEISNDDAQAELQKQLDLYKENDDARKKLESDEYREYLKFRMRNERVIEMVLKAMVKEAK